MGFKDELEKISRATTEAVRIDDYVEVKPEDSESLEFHLGVVSGIAKSRKYQQEKINKFLGECNE